MSVDLSGLSQLSTREKLRLIETLWDEMAAEPASIPLEKWQKAELDRREVEAGSTPNVGSPWHEVKERIVRRHDV